MRQQASSRSTGRTAERLYKAKKASTVLEFRSPGKLASYPLSLANNKAVSPQNILKLLALLAHQISQPLTVLIGEIELALRLPNGEEELRAALERCFWNAEFTSSLVGDFRTLTEMGPTLTCAAPLVEIVTRAVESNAQSADSASCNLKWRLSEELYLETDSEVLQRAISRMLAAAIDDCLPGGTLEIKLRAEGETAQLTLSYPARQPAAADGQPLVPPVNPANLFPRLLETSPSLAISAAMIQALGGTLTVRRPTRSAKPAGPSGPAGATGNDLYTYIKMTIGPVTAHCARPALKPSVASAAKLSELFRSGAAAQRGLNGATQSQRNPALASLGERTARCAGPAPTEGRLCSRASAMERLLPAGG